MGSRSVKMRRAAVAVAAKPLADAELQAHTVVRPGQIGQGAFVVAVDTARRCGAERTRRGGLRRAHGEGDLGRGVIDRTRLKVQCGRIG